MRVAQARLQAKARCVAVAQLDREAERAPRHRRGGGCCKHRLESADVDEDVGGDEQVVVRAVVAQEGDRVAEREPVVHAQGARLLEHAWRQVDAREPARHRPQQRTAQARAAAEVERRRIRARRDAGQHVDEPAMAVVAELLDQVSVEVGGVAVEESLHVRDGRRGRRRIASDRRQVERVQLRLRTETHRLLERLGRGIESPQLAQHAAAQAPCERMLRRQREQTVDVGERVRQAPDLRPCRRTVQQAVDAVRLDGQRFARAGHGLVRLPQPRLD